MSNEHLNMWTNIAEASGVRPFGRRVSFLAEGVKRDSEEAHLLKTVASGGPWHSEVQGEEALLTRLKDWAKSPPEWARPEVVTLRGAKWGGPVDQAPPLGQNAAGSPERPRLGTFYVRNTHFPDMFEFHHCFQKQEHGRARGREIWLRPDFNRTPLKLNSKNQTRWTEQPNAKL